jgi:hypothetical protein
MATNAIKSNIVKWAYNAGRNTRDDPSTIPDAQCREALNMVLENVGLGSRRLGIGLGLVLQNITGAATNIGSLGFGRIYISTGVFLAFTSGLDRSTPPRLIVGVNPLGGVGYTVAATDAISSDARFSDWMEFNGKLYFTSLSTVNRLHEWAGGANVVRTSLPAPAAATMANTGAGAYAATLRYYRIQWHDDGVNAAAATRRIVYSNLGTAGSFTPSGAGTGVNVTRPALPAGEYISHWVVFGSSDGVNFYNLSGLIVAATTVFFDNATPATYFSGRTAAPLEGTFTPWPSVKYLAQGAARMLGFGVWQPNTTSEGLSVISGRVYLSPVQNTTDTHDDERISNTLQTKGWVDVGQRNQGRIDRGILDPIDDVNLVFQDVGVWGLVPTGNDQAPFRRVRLDPRKGSCGQRSNFIGEDESGNPCAYFLDPVRGPYRYGRRGFEWLGYDVLDYCGNGTLVNQADYVHGLWDPVYLCCRWWVNIDSNDEPTTQVVFFPRQSRVQNRGDVRGGWVIHDGLAGQVVCANAGISDGWGTDGNANILIGGLSTGIAPAAIVTISDSSALANGTDNPTLDPLQGTLYEGSLESKAFAAPVAQLVTQIGQCYLQARTAAGVQIQQGILRNFMTAIMAFAEGVSTVDLSTSNAELRVLRKFASLAGLVNQYAFAVLLKEVTRTATLNLYNTAGTFQLIADEEGVAIVDVVGGGGGTHSAGVAYSTAGAGGGGYARFGPTWVRAGDVIDIVVGAGGAVDTAGGESSVTISSTLVARATGGGAPTAAGLTAGVGGQGTNGTVTYVGGAGGNGVNAGGRGGGGGGGAAGFAGIGQPGITDGAAAAGPGGQPNGGIGVTTPSGAGGNGGASGLVGNNGIAAGGGGGGAGSGAAAGGKVGGAGYVRVRIFPSVFTLDRWLSSFENGSEV